MPNTRYIDIATALRSRIAAGEFAGGLLPSETQLCEAHDASRMTVRRALDALRAERLIDSRRGLGWFVSADPLRQSLARLGTIESQLADAGIESERTVLEFGFVAARAPVRAILGVSRVLEVKRLNLAAGAPFARVTVWCPEALARGLSLADVERTSFYELLDIPLGGAEQTIAASAAGDADALLLDIPPGSPVLLCHRTTRSTEDVPVLHSEHVFAAHRTEFVVELLAAGRSIAPSGLRLLRGGSRIGAGQRRPVNGAGGTAAAG